MMGGDIEGIVAGIEALKDVTIAAISSVASGTSYQMESEESHGGDGPCYPKEKVSPLGDVMSGVSAAAAAIQGASGKMEAMGNALFLPKDQFNNSIGSPWNELAKLQEAVAAAESYAGGAAPFNYVGDKAGMIGMLNMVLSMAVDAKWAIIYYHDFIQRGFDNMFNDNNPSITFTNGLNGEQSTGNIAQPIPGNVGVKAPSIDPF